MLPDGGDETRTRRGFLARSGALALAVGVAGCGSGAEGGPTTEPGGTTTDATGTADAGGATGTPTQAASSTADPRTDDPAGTTHTATAATTAEPSAVVELGAAVGGWRGREPSDVDGEPNPTLRLSPGETYEMRWLNLDGERHRLVLADADGAAVHSTTPSAERGATRALRFEATDRLVTYRCAFHPGTMRGTVATTPPGAAGQRATRTSNGTARPTEGANATGTAAPTGNASRGGSNRSAPGDGTTGGSSER